MEACFGKTEELIRRLRRAQIAKMSTVIFKPKIDSRFSNEHIVSHNMNKLKSIKSVDHQKSYIYQKSLK